MILLYFFCVSYSVPVDAEDIRSFGTRALSWSGPVVWGGGLGLSQVEFIPPFFHVLILEAERLLLEGVQSRFLDVLGPPAGGDVGRGDVAGASNDVALGGLGMTRYLLEQACGCFLDMLGVHVP